MATNALLAATLASAAWAGADCVAPMADWQPRAMVETIAAAQGWRIGRLHVDDGCYEIDGWDSEGREVEITLDPATLAVVEIDYEDHQRRPRK
ncbi:PepSY domain-containing protein [Cereibacter changlensis]|nr:PepSY domain-containing protein [Cereibacter changlensis]